MIGEDLIHWKPWMVMMMMVTCNDGDYGPCIVDGNDGDWF